MTDRLTLTRPLEGSGMQSEAAERIATEIYDAIHDSVATKSDLREMEQRLDLRFEQTERRIDAMVIRLGALVVIVAGVLFAALHFIAPAHSAEPQRPYSCRLYDEAQKKCAANSFGPCYVQREVDRLRKECLRDGGRP